MTPSALHAYHAAYKMIVELTIPALENLRNTLATKNSNS
jgi:hypothetical protein